MEKSVKLLYLSHEDKWRGPVLAAFTRKYLVEEGIHDVHVYSAGISESIEELRRTSPGICNVTGKILLEHGLDTSHKIIRYLDEFPDEWDLILATDKGIREMVWEQSHRLYERTLLAGEYADLDEPEIYEPFQYRQMLDESERTERSGYYIMIAKAKDISRGVVERIKRERSGLLGI
jgi:protein-tyrosine-phosphatase